MNSSATKMVEVDLISDVTESCGEVAFACSEVAGIVEDVAGAWATLRDQLDQLRSTFGALEQDQERVADATEEAHLLSEQATSRLNESTNQIARSLERIEALLELVDSMSTHILGFGSAMDQVRHSTLQIKDIAETTSILALNASIQAASSGETGLAFGVIADEVKSLADKTKRATGEISDTVAALDVEAKALTEQMDFGADANLKARQSISQIEETTAHVASLITDLSGQNRDIKDASLHTGSHIATVRREFDVIQKAASENESKLEQSVSNIRELEQTASQMFNTIVHAGMSPADDAKVELCREFARELSAQVEAAISANELSETELFDQNYIEIAGSNPPRFRTGLTGWTDKVWRPIIDPFQTRAEESAVFALSDLNGFLPTHSTKRSQQPMGDPMHDTAFCRNGRIIFDR